MWLSQHLWPLSSLNLFRLGRNYLVSNCDCFGKGRLKYDQDFGIIIHEEKNLNLFLKDEIEGTFSGSWSEIGIDKTGATSVWQIFKKGGRGMSWSRPWALFVLAKWCQRNRVALSGNTTVIRSHLKNVFWPNFCVGSSFQILDIL